MEVWSMDTYALEPVECIHHFVIWNGEPARSLMPGNRQAASKHPDPFTETGSTVYVRSFSKTETSGDEKSSSAADDATTFNEEFAPGANDDDGSDSEDEPFTAFASVPLAFKWVQDTTAVVDPESRMGACHSLRFLEQGANRAYALPWSDECLIWMRLGNRCTLFFTDTMNGCALAIGGDPQTPVVAHSNGGFNGAQAAVDQLSFLREKCPDIRNWRVFSKADYISHAERTNRQRKGHRSDGTQANVIGVYREANQGWEFWCQRWMRYLPDAGGKAFLTDFERVKIFPQ